VTLPLAQLRRLQAAYLNDVCDILRYVETNTADGVSAAWQTVATNVPCRLSSRTLSAAEGAGAAAQARALNEWRVWLPAGTDVTVRDRLVLLSRTFEVSRVEGESNETARACSASEIT
jgi:head-tail adaptor